MEHTFGDYMIKSDDKNFVVLAKKIVGDRPMTKSENVGKETWKEIAYFTKFEMVLNFLPQQILRDNDSILEAIHKINELKDKVELLGSYIDLSRKF